MQGKFSDALLAHTGADILPNLDRPRSKSTVKKAGEQKTKTKRNRTRDGLRASGIETRKHSTQEKFFKQLGSAVL